MTTVTDAFVSIVVSGSGQELLGDIRIREGLAGTEAELELDPERVGPLSIGDHVELTADPRDAPRRSWRLWIREISREWHAGGETIGVLATDPLGFLHRSPQYRSRVGARAVADLLRELLSEAEVRLEGYTGPTVRSPSMRSPWLIQCEETDRALLDRILRELNTSLFWDRNKFLCGTKGSPPGSIVQLEEEVAWRLWQGVPSPREHVRWTDVETRRNREQRARPGFDERGKASRRWWGDRAGPLPLPTSVAARELSLWSPSSELRVGSRVRFDGVFYGVQSIEHLLGDRGSYGCEVRAVPAGSWGRHEDEVTPGLIGPLQATVVENEDPQGLGRVRVTLSEDPCRRPSPWLPTLSPQAGLESGFYWPPERGDLVMCVADQRFPESLYVIGSLRGADHPPANSWKTPSNDRKTISSRGDCELYFDDKESAIVVRVGTNELRLDPEGLSVGAKRVKIDASENMKLNGGSKVNIDAEEIHLG